MAFTHRDIRINYPDQKEGSFTRNESTGKLESRTTFHRLSAHSADKTDVIAESTSVNASSALTNFQTLVGNATTRSDLFYGVAGHGDILFFSNTQDTDTADDFASYQKIHHRASLGQIHYRSANTFGYNSFLYDASDPANDDNLGGGSHVSNAYSNADSTEGVTELSGSEFYEILELDYSESENGEVIEKGVLIKELFEVPTGNVNPAFSTNINDFNQTARCLTVRTIGYNNKSFIQKSGESGPSSILLDQYHQPAFVFLTSDFVYTISGTKYVSQTTTLFFTGYTNFNNTQTLEHRVLRKEFAADNATSTALIYNYIAHATNVNPDPHGIQIISAVGFTDWSDNSRNITDTQFNGMRNIYAKATLNEEFAKLGIREIQPGDVMFIAYKTSNTATSGKFIYFDQDHTNNDNIRIGLEETI